MSNTIARRMAIAAAEREAINETEAAVSRIEDLLHSVEERTLALGEALSVLGPRDGDVDPLLRRFVQGNRDLYGAAIAWMPGARGEHRALYYHWAAEGESRLEAADLASEAYRYWERSWFKEPIAAGGPLWTEPYQDEGGGEASMVTFAVPFSGAGGAPAGVVTADVRLRRLDSIVKGIELGRSGFGLVLSRSGVVIAASEQAPVAGLGDRPPAGEIREPGAARADREEDAGRGAGLRPGRARGRGRSASPTGRSAGRGGRSPPSTPRTSCSTRSPGCGPCRACSRSVAFSCWPSWS